MNELHAAWWIAGKDLRVGLRNRQQFLNTLFFGFLTAVIFGFVFEPGNRPALQAAAPGIVWTAFFFAGMLHMSHAFAQELPEDCMRGLLSAPVERGAIFTGKCLSGMVFLCAMELLVLPLLVVFFDLDFHGRFPAFLVVLLLTDVGFTAVGTLFSAITAGMRSRDVMLPLLLFPVMIPVVVAAVQATAELLRDRPVVHLDSWLKLLGGFDLLFCALCWYIFRFVVEEV